MDEGYRYIRGGEGIRLRLIWGHFEKRQHHNFEEASPQSDMVILASRVLHHT